MKALKVIGHFAVFSTLVSAILSLADGDYAKATFFLVFYYGLKNTMKDLDNEN